MFTEKEIKNMKIISSSKFKYFCYILLFFSAVVSLVGSVHAFILSKKCAQLIHKNMSEIFNGLGQGFSISKTYDGAYCAAIERLGISIKGFFITIIILALMLSFRAMLKRNLKIINLIESKTKQDIIQNENVK